MKRKIKLLFLGCVISFSCCKKDDNPLVPAAKWEKINIGVAARTVNDLQVFNNIIFAGTDSGVCISTDGGTIWTNINIPDKKLNVKKIFFDNNLMFIGTKEAGIYISNDLGMTWSAVNDGIQMSNPPNYPEISSFIADSNFIYAGLPSLSLNTPKPAQIYRKSKDQNTWEAFDKGVETIGVRAFYKYGGIIYAGTWEGIYTFEPALSKWVKFGESNLSFMRFYMKSISLFCSVEQQNIGIMVSSNGGYSWKITNAGISSNDRIWSFSEDDKNNIYCTSYGAVFMSSDEGSTWGQIGSGLPQESILSSIVIENNIFVGSNWNGIWKFKL